MANRQKRTFRWGRALVAIAFGGGILAAGFLGWKMLDETRSVPSPPLEIPELPEVNAQTERAIAAFCGDCHALPRPESFARNQWYDEVRFGYEAYARSGRTDLEPPTFQDTLAYYLARAPEQLQFPTAIPVDERLRSNFTVETLDWGQQNYMLPAVSFLRWTTIEPGRRPRLLACDMRDGTVSTLELDGATRRRVVLGRFEHPCHAEPCDLDGDGRVDLVVADLGSFYPSDHDHGRVILLKRNEQDESFSPVTIAEGLGRVADARPADVDRDGDLDLIVAEFGHFRTGNILLLRNVAEQGSPPRFVKNEVDPRPGAIHVPVHDFDGDGRIDFLGLLSQEHEAVDLFLNRGDGKFLAQNVWSGPDLTFGMSGLELTDLDQDGDTDALFTNGDAFDNSSASPTHGVQWLENLGDTKFAYRRLVVLPGAYRALPADYDGDGDLDVIVVTFLPPGVVPSALRDDTSSSIVVLEQTESKKFVARGLECGAPQHATFEVGDFDGDGDVDFAVGNNLFPHGMAPGTSSPGRVTIWWNQRAAPIN